MMSKILCQCGYMLFDNSDFLSYKARFVADQDFFDFINAVEKEELTKESLNSGQYLGDIFQCPRCGNLMIFDQENNQRYDFMPLKKEKTCHLTQSYLGEKWQGFLRGHYYGQDHFLAYARNKGELSWHTNKESGSIFGISLEELRARYYQKLEELRGENILRSSFLDIQGQREHSWHIGE